MAKFFLLFFMTSRHAVCLAYRMPLRPTYAPGKTNIFSIPYFHHMSRKVVASTIVAHATIGTRQGIIVQVKSAETPPKICPVLKNHRPYRVRYHPTVRQYAYTFIQVCNRIYFERSTEFLGANRKNVEKQRNFFETRTRQPDCANKNLF